MPENKSILVLGINRVVVCGKMYFCRLTQKVSLTKSQTGFGFPMAIGLLQKEAL